jgi:hypothetical protein
MGFTLGLIIGVAAGFWLGGGQARQKRLRQVGAALKEGRVSISSSEGAPMTAEDFCVILDDEFRDA